MDDDDVRDALWHQNDDEFADVLSDVVPTCVYRVLGQVFRFPDRSDYQQAFLQAGLLEPGADIESVPDFVVAAQADWHAGGHNACTFAAYMSANRDEVGWQSIVLGKGADAAADAAAVHNVLGPTYQAPDAEVVSVLLPHVTTVDEVAALVTAIVRHEAWSGIDNGTEDDPEHGELVRLGVSVDLGICFGAEFDFMSEVLMFGPIATFGRTRWAPFFEIAVRVKPPRKRPRDRRTFMAHVNIPGLDNAEMRDWFRQTEAQRMARLGSDHD
jgi:hypothetical protein